MVHMEASEERGQPAMKTPTPVPAKNVKEPTLDMILLAQTRSQFSMMVFWNWLVSYCHEEQASSGVLSPRPPWEVR